MSKFKVILKVLPVVVAALGGYAIAKNKQSSEDAVKYPELDNIIRKYSGIPAEANENNIPSQIPIKIPSNCIRRLGDKIVVGTDRGFWEFFEKELCTTDEDNRVASRWLGKIPGARSLYDIEVKRFKSITTGNTYLLMKMKGKIPNASPAILLRDES